jgi:hypothetical protein
MREAIKIVFLLIYLSIIGLIGLCFVAGTAIALYTTLFH